MIQSINSATFPRMSDELHLLSPRGFRAGAVYAGIKSKQTPFCGVKRDNIYARRASSSGYVSSDVINSPLDADDSVLLPCEQ